MIELLRAGPQTTVQDLGRHGWRDRGLSVCGALDDVALQAGNLLLGNEPGAAGLEFTLGGATLRFHADGWIALTGTDVDADLDGRPLRAGWRAAGSTGSSGPPGWGCRRAPAPRPTRHCAMRCRCR